MRKSSIPSKQGPLKKGKSGDDISMVTRILPLGGIPKPPTLDLYGQLDLLLSKHASTTPKVVFDNFEDTDLMWSTFESSGFIVVKNAISSDSLTSTKGEIIGGLSDMLFGWDVDLSKYAPYQSSLTKSRRIFADNLDAQVFAFDPFRNSRFGHGNASFAYLYKQFLALEDQHFTEIAGQKTSFSVCPGNRITLHLLRKNPLVSRFLLSQPLPEGKRVISIDSCKVSSYRAPIPSVLIDEKRTKMTKQVLTKWHQDTYHSNGICRTQSIIVSEGQNALHFVPNGEKNDVKQLICKILSKSNLYERDGFIGLDSDPKLVSILNKFAVSAPPNSLVVWKSAVPHGSGVRNLSTPIQGGSFDGLFRMTSNAKPVPNQATYRFVCGTQRFVGLSQADINKIAVLSLFDFIPEIYRQFNKGTTIRANLVNLKSTQWKKPRNLLPGEKSRFVIANEFLSALSSGSVSLTKRALALLQMMGYKCN